MEVYLIGFIAPLLSYVLQVWPRLVKRYFGIDTWRWLLFADYVRKNKSLPKASTTRYIVNSKYGYPPLIILILSLFPRKFLEKYQFLFSPFFDFIHNYFIFLASLLLIDNLTVAITAQVIAALTPLIVVEASNLNTRILSYLIFSASFFSLVMFSSSGDYYWIAPAAFGLFMLFFTHRFAIQAYAACVIGFTIVERNPVYLIFFLAVYLLVFVLGGKLYRAILNEHLGSIRYWGDKLDYRFAHPIRGLSKTKGEEDFIQKIYKMSFKNPLFYIFANNPWLVVFLAIVLISFFNFFDLRSYLDYGTSAKLEIWVLSLFTCSLLVLSVKPLRIFGEGQRYLEYGVFPLSIYLASFLSPLFVYPLFRLLFVISAVFLILLILYVQYKTIIKDRARSITPAVWKIINYLNSHDGRKIRLAMFPLQLGDAILYFTKCTILTSDTYIGMESLDDVFPVLKKPFTQIVKKYKLTHLFFDRRYVGLDEFKIKNCEILANVDDYMLVKV